MLKKLLIGLTILASLAGPVHAAGTLPGISMSQQLDTLGRPLNGGKLYLIQAGTTSTPQNCYQDSGLTIAWPNPVTLDSAGRVPQLFCADGSIKIRLTNALGVQQLVQDNLLVVGPSGGGGGGGSVDATTVLATGDLKARYGTGNHSGFVRANGRTIGSATSGATERANSDTQALFEYLCGADVNLAMSGGRGASCAADWAANKALALPDWRGRALAFLDDMGNSASGRLTGTYFATPTTVLGAAGGVQSKTLALGNLPPYTPTGTINSVVSNGTIAGTGAITNYQTGGLTTAPIGQAAIIVSSTFTGSPQGGSTDPFAIIPPMMLATIYIKL